MTRPTRRPTRLSLQHGATPQTSGAPRSKPGRRRNTAPMNRTLPTAAVQCRHNRTDARANPTGGQPKAGGPIDLAWCLVIRTSPRQNVLTSGDHDETTVREHHEIPPGDGLTPLERPSKLQGASLKRIAQHPIGDLCDRRSLPSQKTLATLAKARPILPLMPSDLMSALAAQTTTLKQNRPRYVGHSCSSFFCCSPRDSTVHMDLTFKAESSNESSS